MTPEDGSSPSVPVPSCNPGDSHDDATRYGPAPVAEAGATGYPPPATPPAGAGSTNYPEHATDPGLTNYQVPPTPGDSSATRYGPEPIDRGATGLTPPGALPTSRSGKPLSRHVGGYELLEEISHGGMGVVYKARQLEPERLVALKMIRAGELAGEADVRHFRQEAQEAARLDHPNIVPIYEVGEHEGRHFFSMKLFEGGSLNKHLDRYRQDRKAAAQLVATVARAVHHAHQRQLLHRDLKPGNILLDTEGQPHVADFGLAKRLGGAGDASQSMGVGTPEYMAPEQARGDARLTTAADVYALGGILYALLAGRPPFRGNSNWDTIAQVLTKEPAPPSTYIPGCPRDLEKICLKSLEKEPGRRYGSAEALAEDLERWLRGEPVRARPLGRLARTWRWCRRKPALAGLLATLALVIVGSLIGLTALYLKAERQRRMAEHREAGAQAVTKFYEDHVLAAARPKGWSGGAGKDVTLKEALDLAAPKINDAFAGQAELEASVRDTLGMTYYYLGQFGSGSPHLEKAYELRLQLFGPDHPETLTSLHHLSMERWKQGRNEEAVIWGRQAFEKRRHVLGPEDPETLWSQLFLGLFLSVTAQYDEAQTVLSEAIEICKRTVGPDDVRTLHGQHDLAIVLWEKGNLKDAEALACQTLEGRKRSLGPEHPDTLRTMGSLGWRLQQLGRLKDAEVLIRESLDIRRRVLAPEHIETLWSEYFMGELLTEQGKYSEAEKLLRHCMDVQCKMFGPDHLDLADTLALLGDVLTYNGQSVEGERLLRQSLSIREQKLAPGDRWIAFARTQLGSSLARQGKFTEAERIILAGYEDLSRSKGTPTRQVAKALDRIIDLYEKWGKSEQAEAWRKKRPASTTPVSP
jgi:serine/threonine-protein kinase